MKTELESCGCEYYRDREIRLCKYLCQKHKDKIIVNLYNAQLAMQQNKVIQDYIKEKGIQVKDR